MAQQTHEHVNKSTTRLTGAIIGCPECAGPAEIEWTSTMESTDGCVEHLKIQCVNRHWFFLTSDHVSGL